MFDIGQHYEITIRNRDGRSDAIRGMVIGRDRSFVQIANDAGVLLVDIAKPSVIGARLLHDALAVLRLPADDTPSVGSARADGDMP